jgi:hypothetical protein
MRQVFWQWMPALRDDKPNFLFFRKLMIGPPPTQLGRGFGILAKYYDERGDDHRQFDHQSDLPVVTRLAQVILDNLA